MRLVYFSVEEVKKNGMIFSGFLDLVDSFQIEEKQVFLLFLENIECDSVEVESIVLDGEKNGIGMFIVEDGLFSSQASDIEEGSFNYVYKFSLVMLRFRQRVDIVQELENLDREYGIKEKSKLKEMDIKVIMEDLKVKREVFDIVIVDIKIVI